MDEIPVNQLLEWLDYYNLEPWGYELENYRFGVVASSPYNAQRTKKTDKFFTPEDFFNFNKEKSKPQTSDEMYQISKMFVSAYNNQR